MKRGENSACTNCLFVVNPDYYMSLCLIKHWHNVIVYSNNEYIRCSLSISLSLLALWHSISRFIRIPFALLSLFLCTCANCCRIFFCASVLFMLLSVQFFSPSIFVIFCLCCKNRQPSYTYIVCCLQIVNRHLCSLRQYYCFLSFILSILKPCSLCNCYFIR